MLLKKNTLDFLVVTLFAAITASCCNPVTLTCTPNQDLAQADLYPNKAAFAVKKFDLAPDDMGRSECSNRTLTGNPENTSCPSGTAPGSTVMVNDDAQCPWTYVECFESDRIPMAIQVAQCQCSGCLDPYTHRSSPNLECKPVMRNMKVLRRKACSGGMYKYEEETISVPVACACMRQRVAA